jgi:NADH-quinone oxidoreductase subunit L
MIGLITTLMARIAALYEIDMKKIVALSTLRQLGMMIVRIGLGLYLVAYFHLLIHAFFKALLFITVGNIIHRSSDFQDLRKGAVSERSILISCVRMVRRRLRLIGIPFFSRFYSKDLIIEINIGILRNRFIFFFLLVSLFLTVMYSFRFIYITMISFRKIHRVI